jgi:hypothetical protein
MKETSFSVTFTCSSFSVSKALMSSAYLGLLVHAREKLVQELHERRLERRPPCDQSPRWAIISRKL